MSLRSRTHLKWWIGLAVVVIVVLVAAVYFRMSPSILVEELAVSGAMETTITDYLETQEQEAQQLTQADQLGKVFAAYEVIDKEQVGDEQTLYLWTLQANILPQDDQLRVISGQSGPMVLKLSGQRLEWQVSSAQRPSTENYYQDLQELFPSDLYDLVKDYPSAEILGKLEDRVRVKARTYYQITDPELFAVIPNPPLPPELSTHKVISPHGKKLAYIFPDEWETVSDIYIAEIVPGTPTEGDPLLLEANWRRLSLNQWVHQDLFDLSPGHLSDVYTPKKLAWYDEESLLVIIGYAFGTVSPGGDVVRVNIETGESEIIYAVENNRQQVTDMDIRAGHLLLTITTFDDNMLNPQDSQIELAL